MARRALLRMEKEVGDDAKNGDAREDEERALERGEVGRTTQPSCDERGRRMGVYDLAGIGRFYMGLANHIKIVEAPELKRYVREFGEKWLR